MIRKEQKRKPVPIQIITGPMYPTSLHLGDGLYRVGWNDENWEEEWELYEAL